VITITRDGTGSVEEVRLHVVSTHRGDVAMTLLSVFPAGEA
jgi:hypothetical protein